MQWRYKVSNKQQEKYVHDSELCISVMYNNLHTVKEMITKILIKHNESYTEKQKENIDQIYEKLRVKCKEMTLNEECMIHVIYIYCIDLKFQDESTEVVFKIFLPYHHFLVDQQGHEYQNWQEYTQKNKLPECWMCFPQDGDYNLTNKNHMPSAVQVKFDKSHACESFCVIS